MLDRTLKFIFKHDHFKTLGASRTDAMVSAQQYYCELFSPEEINSSKLLRELNHNLPNDICARSITEVDKDFQIIGGIKRKEYHYYFSYGEKNHPFCAPIMSYSPSTLNIDLMMKAARLFEGSHFFKNYCHRPSDKKLFTRTVESCEIIQNTLLTASFFPEKSFYLKVIGQGFLHHQIRMMMGALTSLGEGKITDQDIINSLKEEMPTAFKVPIASASGLHLISSQFS